MKIDLNLLLGFYFLMIVVFVMALFISKYYYLFQFRDKLILSILGLIANIAALVFIIVDYPSSISFFLAMIPFVLVMGIYKLIKLYQSNGEELVFTKQDKKILKALQVMAATSILIYFLIDYKVNIELIVIASIYTLFEVYGLVKLHLQLSKVKD